MMRQSSSEMKYIKVLHTQKKVFLTSTIMKVPSLPLCSPLTLPKGNPAVSKLPALSHFHRVAGSLPFRKRPILEASLHSHEKKSHKSPEYIIQPNLKFINLKWPSWITFEAKQKCEEKKKNKLKNQNNLP